MKRNQEGMMIYQHFALPTVTIMRCMSGHLEEGHEGMMRLSQVDVGLLIILHPAPILPISGRSPSSPRENIY